MLSPYTSCHFYLILTLINSWTDAVTITEAVNITAVRGSSVCLPCSSHLYAAATVSVKWAKTGSPGKLCDYRVVNGTVETNSIQCEHHVNATEQVSMLCLTGVRTRDAGYYNCSVTKHIPPPAISRCYEVKLHIEDGSNSKLIIICVSALAGTVILICLVVCMYKCKKADSRGGSIVYTNKVYENFSFSKARPPTERTATTQREQCIYEN
ncbi:uncharacterized protein LOC133133184 isoform X2 [Conger conger]|uniref:uncharacterized protein LOC133133184 isoform X2 n=1 Tax=Conger conger TaxID=82655 RepID=UPI002A5AFBA0|nr:uncharacterized protein LOC133133184 isoform X2 [Conger conger]